MPQAYQEQASTQRLLILTPAGMNTSCAVGGTPSNQTLYIENMGEEAVNLTVVNQPSDTSISIPAGSTGTVTIAFAMQSSAGVITDDRNVTDDDNASALVAVLQVVIVVS